MFNKFNIMKIGDLIEWYYKSDGFVITNAYIWSNMMNCKVPIGGTSIFVYNKNKIFSWFNNKGCFSINIDDLRDLRKFSNMYDIGVRIIR